MVYANIKATFHASLEDVWVLVTDLNQQLWRHEIARIEILDDQTFIEHTRDGYSTTFHITVLEPFQRYEFDMKNENMEGHWIGVFSYENEQTTIDFTEDVHAKKLIMKPFVKGYLKKQQTNYINDLKKALHSQ